MSKTNEDWPNTFEFETNGEWKRWEQVRELARARYFRPMWIYTLDEKQAKLPPKLLDHDITFEVLEM